MVMPLYDDAGPIEMEPRGWGEGELESWIESHAPAAGPGLSTRLWKGNIPFRTLKPQPVDMTQVAFNGVSTDPYAYGDMPPEQEALMLAGGAGAALTPYVTPTGVPLVGALGALTVGILKGLWAKYGPTVLKALVGAGVFAAFMKLLGLGAGDDTPVRAGRGKARRYSIGANPRMRTLLKVAKRVDNIFVQYDTRMRKFRSRIRGAPRRQHTYYAPRGRRDLTVVR